MKKILLAAIITGFFSGCFIFQKKEKLGCKTNGRNIGAEKLAAGDPDAMKASRKAKFKGLKSY
ncbi:MAG: hypothetical protein ABIP80_06350 [Ferruginibacter sp.]